jgi:hypothetical protein
MAYYIDIFSPETYERFLNSDRAVGGFTENKKGQASALKPGDKLICYVTRLSRWVGVLEVTGEMFVDETPRFTEESDPYVLRFPVVPKAVLPLEKAVPILDDSSWQNLSFTKSLSKDSSRWTMMVRSSLRKMEDVDGAYLESLLVKQQEEGSVFPLDEEDRKKLKAPRVKTTDNREVVVSIPENESTVTHSQEAPAPSQRESIQMQALLSEIGSRMGMKIWLPRGDKQRVLEHWKPAQGALIERLPLNYDEATLQTIENIDVLWIRGRSIVRAFEVEHTTSIYSGILRLADLMALQPNLNIKTHIVAPLDRREKVFNELTRPVFTYLEKGPLQESCSFMSYDSVKELAKEKRLEYMTEAVLEDFEEQAESSEY